MKRFIILLIFVLSYVFGQSQIYQKISTWEEYLNRFRVTGMFRPPLTPAATPDTGSMYYKKSDTSIRVWSGNGYRLPFTVKQLNDTTLIVGDSTITIRGTCSGSKDIDVFLLAGQSNAVGHGDTSYSPKVRPNTVYQINHGILTPGNDPIGINVGSGPSGATQEKAITGSAWPSFGITYYNQTSRRVCFVPSSVGGSTQSYLTPTAYRSWDSTDVIFDSAVARLEAGMTALRALGYNPIFKGVLWNQGESEALGINSASITQQDYIDAFKRMIRRFRQLYGARMPFYIFRTGKWNTLSDVGFAAVRQAQQIVADSDSCTSIVYYNAVDFLARGGLMADDVHYNQKGLNEMGTMGALSVVANRKNNWQAQDSSLYYTGRVGIGVSRPRFKLDVQQNISTDSIIGGREVADSIHILGTTDFTNTTGSPGFFGGKVKIGKNIVYAEIGTLFEGFLGIGGMPTYGHDLDIKRASPSNTGIRIWNDNTGSGATGRVLFQNNAGPGAQLFMTGPAGIAFGASTFQVIAHQAGGLRLVGTAGDILFANSNLVANPPYASFKLGTGSFLFGTTTDDPTKGRFQINSRSRFDSTLYANNMAAPSGAYNLVVHDADSGFKQIPASAISGITSINSNTGPAFTITNGTGVIVDNSTPNMAIINVNPGDPWLPHALTEFYSAANNTGTTETDLYSYTVPANKLAIDGQKITFEASGTFNDITATNQIRVYFGATEIFNSGGLTISATGGWSFKATLIRASSTTAIATTTLTNTFGSSTSIVSVVDLTSQDFTDANVLKVTGTASGGGGGSNDITAKMGHIMFLPIPL